MKKHYKIILFLIFALNIIGCQNNIPQVTATPFSTSAVTAMPPTSPTATITPIPTIFPTLTSAMTPSHSPEPQVIYQCADVLQSVPDGVVSNGVVILNNASDTTTGTLLMDMATQRTHKISLPGESLRNFVVSVDKKNVAFESAIVDSKTNTLQKQLVIASADGQRRATIPWRNEWYGPLGWTADNRLFFLYDDKALDSGDKHITLFAYAVLNLVTGEQEILLPDFPGYIQNANIPFWRGWFGARYDSSLTRVVYPKMITGSEEFFTFALWDLSNQKIVSSLESIYRDSVYFSIASPMPVWSPDNSQFAFIGHDLSRPGFELYRVSLDGKTEQLTNLSSIALLRGMPFSWSPDGQKIVLLVDELSATGPRNIAVLDIETKDIDFCIPVGVGLSDESYPPIWSPDGQQFLVRDWLDNLQSRVILVDITSGLAVQIAENVEAVGWMVKEP